MAYDTEKPFLHRVRGADEIARAGATTAPPPPAAAVPPSLADRIAMLDKMIEDWWLRRLERPYEASIRGALDLYALRDRLRAEGLHARMQAIAEMHGEMIAGAKAEITPAMIDRAANVLEAVYENISFGDARFRTSVRTLVEEMLKAALVSK